jgi:tetratricopeptide (TPR) repeat protein
MASYKDGLAIADRLAKADPGNLAWQRDLSVSYDRMGDVLASQGDLAGALATYKDSLAIFDRITKANPANLGWQADLAWSCRKLGLLYARLGDLVEAKRYLERRGAVHMEMRPLKRPHIIIMPPDRVREFIERNQQIPTRRWIER